MDNDLLKTNRRDFIRLAAAGSVLATMHASGFPVFAVETAKGLIPLVKLPFPANALAPFISEKTVNQHYNSHHMAYYKQVTGYVKANPDYAKTALDDLLKKTKGGILVEDSIYNMGILLWNHNFYWQSLKPKGGVKEKGALAKAVTGSFGSIDKFKKAFVDTAMDVGIGWVWLVKTADNKLKVIRTVYHDGLITANFTPLLTLDVWEHAYYMDYGNDRKKYVENYLNNIANWDFAEANFKAVKAAKKPAEEKKAAPKKKPAPEKKATPKKKEPAPQ